MKLFVLGCVGAATVYASNMRGSELDLERQLQAKTNVGERKNAGERSITNKKADSTQSRPKRSKRSKTKSKKGKRQSQ